MSITRILADLHLRLHLPADLSARPTFLRLYLLRLRELGLGIEVGQIDGSYRRWNGDAVELNRGEVLLLDR